MIIDDLDRCAAPKAAELLDCLQLLTAGNGEEDEVFPVVFLLGLDREKVAAGVAVKYENMLPYVGEGVPDNQEGRLEAGRRFGYEYLQKFIGVPFKIPVPVEKNIETFIDKIAQYEPVNPVPQSTENEPTVNKPTPASPAVEEEPVKPNNPPKRKAPAQNKAEAVRTARESSEQKRVEYEEVIKQLDTRASLRMAAPLLDNNPRRIIQYQNLLSLRAFQGIQDEVDLFKQEVTVEHLAKVLVIELARPIFYRALVQNPSLRKEVSDLINLGDNLKMEQELQTETISEQDLRWLKGAISLLRRQISSNDQEEIAAFPMLSELEKIISISPQ